MKGRIALVQFHSCDDDRINLKGMVGFVKREKGRSDLIVFPELAIKRIFSAKEEKELLKGFGDLAKKNRVDLIPGSVLVRSNGKVYNRSYYINRRGKVLAKYDKSNPWRSEKISKGKGPRAFKTRFGRTTLIICWDLASPEIAAKLAKMGLDLIICPSLWWDGRESGVRTGFTSGMIDSLCMARCYESRSVLAYANAGGKVRIWGAELMSAGRSQVVAPFDRTVVRAAGGECVVRHDFNLKRVRLAKSYLA